MQGAGPGTWFFGSDYTGERTRLEGESGERGRGRDREHKSKHGQFFSNKACDMVLSMHGELSCRR